MNQGRRRRSQDAYAAYRRPEAQPSPEWADQPAEWAEQAPAPEQSGWAPPEETAGWTPQPEEAQPPERSWNAETVWDDEPMTPQYDNETYFVPEEQMRQVIATNRAIRLSCTLAAMSGLFALFLCFAERESDAIRRYAVQSVAVLGMNLICGLIALLIGLSLGSIPLMGFVISLLCWLIFIGCTLVMIVVRVRMMLYAWRGLYFRLPLIGTWLEHKFM